MIGAYDIAGVNKWALATRLSTDRFFMTEIDDQTWYIDNYCARAVPTPSAFVRVDEAPEDVRRSTRAMISREGDVQLHDTGLIRRSEVKGKPDITIWKTADGVEVGVREDFAKLLGKRSKLYAAARDPEKSALVIRVDDIPVAVIMPVRIRKEGTP